jgi:type III secretion system (T3SS) SseB-like protein
VHVTALHALGFIDAGIYTVDVLPVAIRFLLEATERTYAAIYEHPKAGVWINFVRLFEDGTSITFTNTQDRGLEKRPGHPTVHRPGATASQLYPVVHEQSPAGTRKQLSPSSIVSEFEQAWADGVRWRKSRGGISTTEVASVILSRGSQPTRVLRPDRIHYVAEQDGAAERDLKAALTTLFERGDGVEKAYLVFVKYDESPEGGVALGLVSSSKDLALVDGVRKIFASRFAPNAHLDILFVTTAEAARIGRVCAPFYARASR